VGRVIGDAEAGAGTSWDWR